MVLPKKALIPALTLIAVIASIETVPKLIAITLAVPTTSSSPLNEGPLGSSNVVSTLESLGTRVVFVADYSELIELAAFYKDEGVTLLFIAPEGLDPDYADALVRSITGLIRQGINVTVFIADEVISEGLLTLLDSLQSSLCGLSHTARPVATTLNDATWLVVHASRTHVLQSGLIAVIDVPDLREPLIPSRPARVGEGLNVIAYTLLIDGGTASWKPVGFMCEGERGKLVYLGDSTLFINALSKYPAYSEAVADLLNYTIGGGVVVVDARAHVSRESIERSLSRFHPSLLLIPLLATISEYEKQVLQIIASNTVLYSMMIVSLGVIVWSLVPLHDKARERLEPRARRVVFEGVTAEVISIYCSHIKAGNPLEAAFKAVACRATLIELPVIKRLVARPLERLVYSTARRKVILLMGAPEVYEGFEGGREHNRGRAK